MNTSEELSRLQAEEIGVENPQESAVRPPDASPSAFLDRITVSAPADWVTIREAGENFRRGSEPVSLLLIDRQHHAARHEVYQHTVQLLDTMQAVQQASQWQLAFDPSTQQVVIHSLRIRRDCHVVEHALPDRFRLMQREENLERLVLDGSVTLVVLLEDVRVGDMLDASFTIQTTPRLFRERFTLLASAPEMMAVREFHVSVRFPAGSPPRWRSSSNGFSPLVREVENDIEWLWSLENIRPVVPEPCVPPGHLPTHWLQVSDCASWADVASEFVQAWGDVSDDAGLLQIASEIAAATPDPTERADRAIALLQDEIRYLSVNTDLGGQTPSPPGVVFQRRFGDCKDKSFLLTHLLRSLGIPAHPVLVSGSLRQTIESLLPTPSVFDHCIVGYQINGQRRWIDVTLPFQGGGALGRQLPDFACGLPIHSESTGLEAVPAESKRCDRYRLQETFRPDSAGGMSVLEAVVNASGQCADNLRRSMMLEGSDHVAKSREDYYRQRYPGLLRLGSIQWRDDRAANEFTLAETYEIPNLLVPCQGPEIFAFQCDAHLIQAILALPGGQSRRFPMEFSPPCQVEHWIDLETPNIVHQNIEPCIVRADVFHFWCETRRSAIHFNLTAHANVVMPEEFDAHRAAVEKALAGTAIRFSVPSGVPLSRRGRRPAQLPNSLSLRTSPMMARSGAGFRPSRTNQKMRIAGEPGTDTAFAANGSSISSPSDQRIISTGPEAPVPASPSATKRTPPGFPRKNLGQHTGWRMVKPSKQPPPREETIPIWLTALIALLLLLVGGLSFFLLR